MNIRLASPNDFSNIMILIHACIVQMESRNIYQWDEIYPDETTIRNDIANSELWVIEDRDTLCGIIVLNQIQSPVYQQIEWRFKGKILVVHRLAIAPHCQGKNLATQLMSFAENLAIQRKFDVIRLDTFAKNPGAVRLYEKLHYHNAGTIELRKGLFYCFEKQLLEP